MKPAALRSAPLRSAGTPTNPEFSPFRVPQSPWGLRSVYVHRNRFRVQWAHCSQHNPHMNTRRRSRSESYAQSLQSRTCALSLNKGGAHSFVCGPITSTQSSSPTNVDIAVTMVTSPRARNAVRGRFSKAKMTFHTRYYRNGAVRNGILRIPPGTGIAHRHPEPEPESEF